MRQLGYRPVVGGVEVFNSAGVSLGFLSLGHGLTMAAGEGEPVQAELALFIELAGPELSDEARTAENSLSGGGTAPEGSLFGAERISDHERPRFIDGAAALSEPSTVGVA